MKRKILSCFTLFAMLISVFATDTSLFGLDTSVKVNADAQEEAKRLRVQIFHMASGTPTATNFGNIVGDSRYSDEGQAYPAFVNSGTIVFRVVDAQDNPVPNARIYWTNSNTRDPGVSLDSGFSPPDTYGGRALGKPNDVGIKLDATGKTVADPTIPLDLDRVPMGTQYAISLRVFSRHAGGVTPKWNPVWDPGSSTNPDTMGRMAKLLTADANGIISAGGFPTRPINETNMDYFNGLLMGPAYSAVPEVSGDRDVYTVSAMAFPSAADMAAGTYRESHPITRSFMLIGANDPRVTDWKTNNYLIFSIYANSYDLFDHTKGITVPGIDREEWTREYRRMNPENLNGKRPYQPDTLWNRTRPDYIDYTLMEMYAPTLVANWNRRGRGAGEIEAFVECFDAEGTGATVGNRHFAQSAGLRVKGGWSRGTYFYEQRTFEFYARNNTDGAKDDKGETLKSSAGYDRGGNNSFEFPLFGTDNNIETETSDAIIGTRGNLVHEYKRFRVRNGGSDRDYAFMRDELSNTLFRQAGFQTPPQNYRPGVVFLNGAYYGLVFVKSPRTENHWDKLYGARENNFHLIGSSEAGDAGCVSENCGRVLIGQSFGGADSVAREVTLKSQMFHDNSKFLSPEGESKQGTGKDDSFFLVGNVTTPQTYYGWMPRVCGGDSSDDDSSNAANRRCTGARATSCKEYWSSANDMCGGSDDGSGRYIPHRSDLGCGKDGSTEHSKDQYRPGDCTGCKATCDWNDVKRLIFGLSVKFREDLGGPEHGDFPNAVAPHVSYTGPGSANEGTSLNDGRKNPVGLSDPARWAEFQRRVDCDSLFLYYALSLYIANVDWPANNIEMWRYFPEDDETKEIEAGTSSLHPQCRSRKWYIVAQDGEMGYNIHFYQNPAPSKENYNNLNAVINRGGVSGQGGGHYGAGPNSFMMPAILGSPNTANGTTLTGAPNNEGKIRLANAFVDIMHGPYATTNAVGVFTQIRDSIAKEHEINVGTTVMNYAGWEPGGPISKANRRIAEVQRITSETGQLAVWMAPTWGAFNNGAAVTPTVDSMDSAQSEKMRIQAFLEKRATNIQTILGYSPTAVTGDGVLNDTNYQPGAGLGMPWSGRTVTATVSVATDAQGYGIVNSRTFGMENTVDPFGRNMGTDPRTQGRGTALSGLTYYPGGPIPLQVVPNPGYVVDEGSWPAGAVENPYFPGDPNRRVIMNASTSFTWTPTFKKSDKLATEGRIRIDGIKATAYNSNGDDWIQLRNDTDKAMSTKGLFLTDNGGSLYTDRFKFKLPSLIIRPGESAFIPTMGNTKAAPSGSMFTSGANGVNSTPTAINATNGKPFFKRTKTNFNIGFSESIRLLECVKYAEKGDRVLELTQAEVSMMMPNQEMLRHRNGNFYVYAGTNVATPGKGFTPRTDTGIGEQDFTCPFCGKEDCKKDDPAYDCYVKPPEPTYCGTCGLQLTPVKLCTCAPQSSWTLTNGQGTNATSEGHVLTLSNADLQGKTKLTITFNCTYGGSSGPTTARRFALWTNANSAIGDIGWLTDARQGTSWVRSNRYDVGVGITYTIEIDIPASLKGSTTAPANVIYLTLTTDKNLTDGDNYTKETNHRGGHADPLQNFNQFSYVTIT